MSGTKRRGKKRGAFGENLKLTLSLLGLAGALALLIFICKRPWERAAAPASPALIAETAAPGAAESETPQQPAFTPEPTP